MSVESNPGLNWFCFTVLFDWSRKLAPPSQPIRCKLKPIALWSLAFSRATGRLHAFTSSCHWLPLIISFTLIGRCDYFGFGFRHSIEKRSNEAYIKTKFNYRRQTVACGFPLASCTEARRMSLKLTETDIPSLVDSFQLSNGFFKTEMAYLTRLSAKTFLWK